MEQVKKKKDDEKTEKYNTSERQGSNSQNQINKEEIRNPPEREFRVT